MFNRSRDKHDSELRVLLAGPYPEPVGGVSVHIARLSSWLSGRGVEVDIVDESRRRKDGVYSIRSLRFLPYLRCLTRCNVAHIQSSVHLFRIFHIALCRLFGLRVVVTIHSWRPGRLATLINRLFLKLVQETVLVSEHINDDLQLSKYQIIPAFLPPPESRQALPDEMQDFLAKGRAQGMSLLCANAYELVENNGEDLYGLDLCVELMARLARQAEVRTGIVYVVSCDAKDNPLYHSSLKQIKEWGLENRFYLYNKPVDFITLMQNCDVVLRPTNTDGDALTVREALYLGMPVIASDAVQRPPGTVLFKNRDVDDFMRCTLSVLNGGIRRTAPTRSDYNSHFEKYLEMYFRVLNS